MLSPFKTIFMTHAIQSQYSVWTIQLCRVEVDLGCRHCNQSILLPMSDRALHFVLMCTSSCYFLQHPFRPTYLISVSSNRVVANVPRVALQQNSTMQLPGVHVTFDQLPH